MITAEFEHDLNQNRMILSESELQESTEEEFQSEMLIRNEIQGLLLVHRRIFNNQIQYCYDISGMQSLSAIIEHDGMNREELGLLFQALFDCIRSVSVYLLEESGVLLDQERIFIHLPSYQIKFCYFPGRKEPLKGQLNHLMEYLMNHIDYKDQKAILFLYSLYMKNKENVSSLRDLEEFLNHDLETNLEQTQKELINEAKEQEKELCVNIEEPNKGQQKPAKKFPFTFQVIVSAVFFLISIGLGMAAIHSGLCLDTFQMKLDPIKLAGLILILFVINVAAIKLIFQINFKTKENRAVQKILEPISKVRTKKEEKEGEKEQEQQITWRRGEWKKQEKPLDISSDENETVVLFDPTAEPNKKAERMLLRLIPKQTELYQTIIVDETPFYIGKLKTRTNTCISNSAISRIHSKIVEEEGKFLLYDMNSTNGTFINGNRLPVNGWKEIKAGDIVEFANIMFCVELI